MGENTILSKKGACEKKTSIYHKMMLKAARTVYADD